MIKKVLLLLISIVIIGGGVGYYFFNKKVPGLNQVTPDYTITANDLFNAFDADETAALALYEGKVLEITGNILSTSKSKNGIVSVLLDADNAMAGGVNCSFKKPLPSLPNSSQIKIKGRCQGFLMSVVLNNCSLIYENN